MSGNLRELLQIPGAMGRGKSGHGADRQRYLLKLSTKQIIGGSRMTNEEYKEKLLNAYIELIEKHKDDKAALKEIDIAFDEPLAEVSE
jgi:hypothetical protein